MITMLVDKLDSPFVGLTTTIDKLDYNLQKFGATYFKSFMEQLQTAKDGGITDFMPCGRFIAVIQKKRDLSETAIIFVDLRNNRDEAMAHSKSIVDLDTGESYAEQFMKVFETLHPNYYKNYYEVELSLESAPLN